MNSINILRKHSFILIKIVAFLLIFLIYTLTHFSYWKNKPNYPADAFTTVTYTETLPYYKALKEDYSLKTIARLLKGYPHAYSPGQLIINAHIMLLIGTECKKVNFFVNSLALLFLFLTVYLLAKELHNNRVTALLTSITILLYPPIFMLFKIYYLDYHLTWIVTFSIYLLIKTDSFRSFKRMLIFSLAFAWGMLVKFPFMAFLAGPLLYTFYLTIKDSLKEKTIYRILNFTVFLLIVSYIIAPNYFNSDKLEYMIFLPTNEGIGQPWYSFANLRIFTFGIFETQLSIPFLILMLSGIFFMIKSKRKQFSLILLYWILIPTVIFIAMVHWKTVRYFLPLMPAYALITSYSLNRIKNALMGRIILVLLLSLGIYQIFDFNRLIPHVLYWKPLFNFKNTTIRYFYPYRVNQWMLGDSKTIFSDKKIIVDRLKDKLGSKASKAGRKEIANVFVLPAVPLSLNKEASFSPDWLVYLEDLLFLNNVKINTISYFQQHLFDNIGKKRQDLKNTDFILEIHFENSEYYGFDDPLYLESFKHALAETNPEQLSKIERKEFPHLPDFFEDARKKIKEKTIIFEKVYNNTEYRIYLYELE